MLYQYLNGDNWRHIYIVGDLHGCRALLDRQLLAASFDPQQDLLIAVGDLIDRGPDSLGCLRLLAEPWFRSVRGNHEEMALNALLQNEKLLWKRNGGDWFWQLEEKERDEAQRALMQCQTLPLILHISLEARTVVVAHADYPAAHYAFEQPVDEYQVVWGRKRIHDLQRGRGETIVGADAFYFGHTPLDQPLSGWNQHFIDTGAVFDNQLTLVKIQ
ncbi:serine/threonine protein phosphatase 1 [Pantoea alhagi]|uniref:metallophosphoesterase n=1 Tax=Mixta sp. BE291 TaxID=3158787 RepID=UPI0028611FCD|nr:serine/threonine protein phosphatase 1 [Pantoea alhagi]